MIAPKHNDRAAPARRARVRFRLVEDGDMPVFSPALALQQSLAVATEQSLERYDSYPRAFRVLFPIIVSIGLWNTIIRLA